ncbi:carboxylesterase/lipase family protein [Sneathiella sp.]|uniref:carboxylesterase/lipase family protein n=1 Tax=Sneathiella sp. TaxID=1964365 RepID=UPI003569ADFE
MCCLAAQAVLADEVRLTIPQGDLVGDVSADGVVSSYKGIPYAIPPVGDRRWTAAEAAPAWTGRRSAKQFGPACMQPNPPEMMSFGPGTEQPLMYIEPVPVMSEDCLHLNVWSPLSTGHTEQADLPVMVWIHGGGFTTGFSSMPVYDGEALARQGVIVVSINYRMGIFGFFAHPELSAENPDGIAANFGITDQVAALRWVRENISAFGGNPDNVTIFGESAGSWAVSLMMATPMSDGLFQKAIGQSGAYFYAMPSLKEPAMGYASAESMGQSFAAQVTKEGLQGLRSMTAQDLLDKTVPGEGVPNFGQFVVVDRTVFNRPVRDTFAHGEQHAVPVIVGFNSDEGSGLSDYGVVAPTPASAADYEAELQTRYGDLAAAYLKQYPAAQLTDAVFDSYRDSEFGWRMEYWAGLMERVGAPAWLYYFSHVAPFGETERWVSFGSEQRKLGAFHASEIPFVFNNLDVQWQSDVTVRSDDLALAETMSAYWVNFAKTGDPNGGDRPLWAPYKSNDQRFMSFADDAKPAINLLPGSLELHYEIDSRRAERGIAWDGARAGLLGQTEK